MGAAAADEKEEDGVEEDKEDDGNNGEAGAMQTYGCHGKQDVAASGRSEVDVSRAIGRIEVFVRQMRGVSVVSSPPPPTASQWQQPLG